MPNLVPLSQTPRAAFAHFALRGFIAGRIFAPERRITDSDRTVGSFEVRQAVRSTSYHHWRVFSAGMPTCGSVIGLPDRPANPITAEPDRKAPTYTNPNKSDADVKLAQFVRITGLKGTSVLSRADYRTGKQALGRMVTAQGKATRNVPDHLSGEYPDERCAVVPTDGTDCTITGDEIRFLRRYRDGMRGKAFSRSMMLEAAERDAAFWRAANPWIPCDSHGIPWKGASYKRQDGIGERLYSDGEMLTEKRLRWIAEQNKSAEQLARDAEIARLVADSKRDARETRTRKVKLERDEAARKMPLHF